MRTSLIALVLLGAGFGAGYFVRGQKDAGAPARADRDDARPADRRGDLFASLTDAQREQLLRDAAEVIRRREAERAPVADPEPAALEEAAAAPDAEGADEMETWLRSASSQWKAFAAMQAKNKVRGLLDGLGFDPETAARIEAAIVADVERQVDRAIGMMLGEEDLEESAFTSMLGIPPDLSLELERDLGTYLSDEDIAAVRDRVKGAHQKQMNDMADVQIASMGIKDLTADQKMQLRDTFIGRDVMSQQMTQFAELTRNRKKFLSIIEDEKALTDLVKKNMEPQRRRVRDILNDEQFKRYEAFEANIVQQARMGMKMMSSMMKKPTDSK